MKIIKWTILTSVIVCVLQVALILYDGFVDSIAQVDVALVLGNKVNEDGTVSKRLQSRLDKTIELYKQNYFDKIIVSGGLGREGHDEAVVMKNYLMRHDVDSSHIIVDSDGINTYMSSVNTGLIMKEHNWRSVLVISNYYHIRRAKLAIANRGITEIQTAHADYYELRDIYSILREMPAYVSYLWK